MQNAEQLLKLLIDNDVEFILIGGYAAVVHGCSTLTQDIDACIPFTKQNAQKLIATLEGINPIHRENKKTLTDKPDKLAQFKNLYLITDHGPLDLLDEVAGLGSYDDVSNHTIELDLFGKKCRVLDIESLIKAKEQMTRPKDKETVTQLKAIQEKITG